MAMDLTPAEQRELQSRMERKQMSQFVDMYSRLVDRCFNACVSDFTSKSLMSKEEACVSRCVDKFMKASERLGTRFQEKNAEMAQQGSINMR